MKHFKTIAEYNKDIGISAPKHPHFDIRRFEDNMNHVKSDMPAFRHEFYSIAIKANGGGKFKVGDKTSSADGVSVFFNSPFQILSWDILPNWSGYYIMFSQDFLAQSRIFDTLLDEFPFLKIDKAIPFEIPENKLKNILLIFRQIEDEYYSDNIDKQNFINSYVLLLLNLVKRLFNQQVDNSKAEQQIRNANLKLLTRFQELIKNSFQPNGVLEMFSNPHSTSFYAQILNIHPNHLNAVVKSITGLTALNHIHDHIIQLAKGQLSQTTDSMKEIAYSLHFETPSHFSSFFKKKVGVSPKEFRNNNH
ncbi:MAG: helix-turn-helix domain-containing protein [Marinifilaceae bacterium]|jgi:AraC-like DNA-binding protein|nr:helix-turn-helix domain-containing protein [Marinifilaceae bacterium]